MKNFGILLIFLLPFLVFSGCGNSSHGHSGSARVNSSDTGTAIITFKEYEHDFGKVAEGEKLGFVFTFENTGSGNLVINSAATSCGCTVPKYDTSPISPGKEWKS